MRKKETMSLYRYMSCNPWPFLVTLPVILIVFIAVGWTRDNIIEDEVNEIWVPSQGNFAQDKDYAESVGKGDPVSSVFAAMAISRDGTNLLVPDRLEEIRARMEKAEGTTVEYNGVTYTWDDICRSNNAGVGTVYQFPCLRISPMDLYQEAQWFFDETDRLTWYETIIQDSLLAPRLPRFGIMQNVCSSNGGPTSVSNACDRVLRLRQDPAYAVDQGFPASYANPLALFSDIGNLEFNHPCRICIEQGFETTMATLTAGITGVFQVMFAELNRFRATLTDPQSIAELDALIAKVGAIVATMSRGQVEEFWSYFVARSLYAQLGAPSYMTNYATFMENFIEACLFVKRGDASMCPATITLQEATAQLLQHADNSFSSITTAGSPLPFWDTPDGTGSLFTGPFPVGGSGVSLTGTLLSSSVYMDLENVQNLTAWRPLYSAGFMDPITPDPNWVAFVESDPVYKWFIAGVTPKTSHCGNGNLTGTNTGNPFVDVPTNEGMANNVTQRWCTKFNVPFEVNGTFTEQHFARMWYDLLIDSNSFLGITQGESNPYTWTTGQGCGYTLRGTRYSYSNQTEADVLSNSSRLLYYVDEGESVGPIDRSLIIGGATPAVGSYDFANPLERVSVIQNLYPSLHSRDIPNRVSNCNRPGGPVDITVEDGEEILFMFKEAFENNWVEGWDDENNGKVQFVGFSDDQGGVVGTTGRLLVDITLDNGQLTAISVALIAIFSAIFLSSCDLVESRVLLTLIGVLLVILSFFAALGLGILFGIKINVTIAWTLPFIILGLGVDDVYIVMLALKKQGQYSKESFLKGMAGVLAPVTMTSLVNAAMFAVMNIVDIPAVYKTAQMAVISVIFLYLTVVLCFPAYCYLDMKRQEAGKYDVLVCVKKESPDGESDGERAPKPGMFDFIYDKVYKPLILGPAPIRYLVHLVIWVIALALFGVGVYGITERSVGLGLEDFFPTFHQAHTWATVRTEELASWSIGIAWGALDYGNPDVQMGMIRQFEQVISTPHVSQVETKLLWMASFLVWTTRQCSENFGRDDPNVLECGRDQIWPVDGSTCSGYWEYNRLGLREKIFGDGLTCIASEEGICRPTTQMHPSDLLELGINPMNPTNLTASWCPVFSDWSDDKLAFCIRKWSNFTGGDGDLVEVANTDTENPQCANDFFNDAEVVTPLPFSRGPTMFAIDLFSHEDTLDLIRETRAFCDDDPSLHCFMGGIPYDYWEQYLWVEDVLLELSGASIAVGFGVSVVFLLAKLASEGNHGMTQNLLGSISGGLLIALTTVLSLISVIGLSVLFGVNLTAFSVMSFVLSVGFAVEYSVHIVHRWLEAPLTIRNPLDRVEYAMSFLTLPTFMSFVSSTIGVACLAFTDFEFNRVFFFVPLIIVMVMTYFYGCWFLPVLLSILDADFLKLGVPEDSEESINAEGEEAENPKVEEAPQEIDESSVETPAKE